MDKKRILIVSASFYPMISPRSFRTTELAKEFVRQGHEVVVYIPDQVFDYSSFIKEYPIRIKYLGSLKFKPIKQKGKRAEMLIRRTLRRVLGLLFEYPSIELMLKIPRHLKKETGYDLMISIAVPYPIHWGIAKVTSKKKRIAEVWVADCGDPYMGCKTDSYRKPFYFKYFEKWFSRKCDYISVPNEIYIPHFYSEFRQKMVVIPQGFRIEEVELAKEVKNEVITFAYAGSIIPGIRDFNLFFDFLRGLDLDFRFYIYTKHKSYFEPFLRQFGERVVLCKTLPRMKLLYELSKCDFLINVDTIHDCNSQNAAFPSKLIDYSFTSRPILNICSNELDQSTTLEFLSGNYRNRRRINSKDYAIEKVTSKFLSLI